MHGWCQGRLTGVHRQGVDAWPSNRPDSNTLFSHATLLPRYGAVPCRRNCVRHQPAACCTTTAAVDEKSVLDTLRQATLCVQSIPRFFPEKSACLRGPGELVPFRLRSGAALPSCACHVHAWVAQAHMQPLSNAAPERYAYFHSSKTTSVLLIPQTGILDSFEVPLLTETHLTVSKNDGRSFQPADNCGPRPTRCKCLATRRVRSCIIRSHIMR